MGLQQWLDDFCKLHERARNSMLGPDKDRYLAARNELARALLKAQRIALQTGEVPRSSLRAAVALSITIQVPGGAVQTLTRDVGSGGFSVILPSPPGMGTVLPFSLRLPGNDTVEGKARLVGLTSNADSRRASFTFEPLPSDVIERIEMVVFDAVVGQLKG
jgi:hypothetical protein